MKYPHERTIQNTKYTILYIVYSVYICRIYILNFKLIKERIINLAFHLNLYNELRLLSIHLKKAI